MCLGSARKSRVIRRVNYFVSCPSHLLPTPQIHPSCRHHKYPFDYAASEFGVDQQFNPTKIFIDALAAVGLVTNRKRATGAWAKLVERRDKEEEVAVATSTAVDKKSQ